MRFSITVVCAFLVAALSLVTVDSADAIKILFHGRNPGEGEPPEPTFRGDPASFDHLQAVFGAENVVFMEGIFAAEDGSSANGFDVVFISATMASSNTRDKYEDSPVGIVIGEHANTSCCTVGNFAMVTSTGGYDGLKIRNKIDIMDPSHPVAAGLSGHVSFFSSDLPVNDPNSGTQWAQYGAGALGAGVVEIARWDTTDLPNEDPVEKVIFAADKGAALLGDGSPGIPATAAGRRVFFGAGDFHGSDLTADGFKLFDAAISWSATDLPGDFNGNGIVDAADYVVFRDNQGSTNVLSNDNGLAGTVNAVTGNVIGQAHYDLWRANFGNLAPSGSGSALGTVPEPASYSLALIALLGVIFVRRLASRKS